MSEHIPFSAKNCGDACAWNRAPNALQGSWMAHYENALTNLYAAALARGEAVPVIAGTDVNQPPLEPWMRDAKDRLRVEDRIRCAVLCARAIFEGKCSDNIIGDDYKITVKPEASSEVDQAAPPNLRIVKD